MNQKNLVLAVIIIVIGIFLFLVFRLFQDVPIQSPVPKAEATFTPKVNICHCEQPDSENPFQCQTLNIAVPASIAHLLQHDADHAGSCSADVCENLEGIQESTPEGLENVQGVCQLPDFCPEEGYQPYGPCEEPEEECEVDCEPVYPPPTGPLPGDGRSSSPSGPSVCSDKVPGSVANINVEVGVPNDNKLEVQWSLPEGADKVHIRYREYSESTYTHALLNTANDGNEVIGELKNGVNYAFSVAGVNGCAVGEFSREFDPKP